MQLRADERKKRRDALRQKYEDSERQRQIALAEEEERKIQEEEERRRAAKERKKMDKQRELQMLAEKEAQYREWERKVAMADACYRRLLMKYHGWAQWKEAGQCCVCC